MRLSKQNAILFKNRFIPADEAHQLGFVHKVVSRGDLEAETMAQAERIAVNDLLSLRRLKQSINGAQDAMGYRTSVHTAHSNYMVTISGHSTMPSCLRVLMASES
jgi:enoyl-CoA hydratase